MALITPFLVLLLFVIVDFSRAWHRSNDQNDLANRAARYAAVGRNPGGTTKTLATFIKEQAASEDTKAAVTVCIAATSTTTVGSAVKATVTSSYTWLPLLSSSGNLPFFGNLPGLSAKTITGNAEMRIERLPAAADGVVYGCS